MGKKNLVDIAKNRKPRKSTIVEKKKEEEKLTPEEERNLKAKAKVEELLHDSPIVTLDKKKEKVESKEEQVKSKEEPKGVEWLEEQVQILTQENQALLSKIQVLESMGGGDNSEVTNAVVSLFEELQTNHIKLGMNQQTGVGNFRIYCPGFLNRMIKFFPFLEEYKQY